MSRWSGKHRVWGGRVLLHHLESPNPPKPLNAQACEDTAPFRSTYSKRSLLFFCMLISMHRRLKSWQAKLEIGSLSTALRTCVVFLLLCCTVAAVDGDSDDVQDDMMM